MDRKNFGFWLPTRKSTRNRAIHKFDSNLQPIRELRKSTMFCKRIGRFFSSQQQLRKSTRNRAIHKFESSSQPIRELRKSTVFCTWIGGFLGFWTPRRKSTRNHAIYKVFKYLQYISDLRKSTVIYIWIGEFLIVGYKSENLQRNTLYIKSAPSSNTSVDYENLQSFAHG